MATAPETGPAPDAAAGRPRVLLLGAGHAHLEVLRRGKALVRAGAELVIADPGAMWYSGMATGMVAGNYAPDQIRVDPAPLARAAGARLLPSAAVAVDPAAQTVRFADGQLLRYTLLSVGVGSATGWSLGAPEDGVYAVKPIHGLATLRARIEAQLRTGSSPRICVVGGGATGVELALCLAGLVRRAGVVPQIRLLASGSTLLGGHPAQGFARRHLAQRGVEVLMGQRVLRREQTELVTQDGARHAFEYAVVATGLQLPDWLRGSGLSCSDAGLRVGPTLQSIDDPRVFAAGDCADFAARALPRLGVYGVRAGPVLAANLLRALNQRRLRRFRPQRRALSILNLGDGRGLALRGRFWLAGRLALWLKDRIDRRFLRRYRAR